MRNLLILMAIFNFSPSIALAGGAEWSDPWKPSESRSARVANESNIMELKQGGYYENVGKVNQSVTNNSAFYDSNNTNIGTNNNTNTIGSVNTATNNITSSGTGNRLSLNNSSESNGSQDGSVKMTAGNNLSACSFVLPNIAAGSATNLPCSDGLSK